jgi:ABC-type amino acid transport substrate-binding protein
MAQRSTKLRPTRPTTGIASRKPGKLVIGTAADYPPFEFYNSNFELDGFDIALAKALGEELGLEVEFNDYAFDGLLDQVQLGQCGCGDCRHFCHTRTKRERVDFTNLYYVGSSASRGRADLHPDD